MKPLVRRTYSAYAAPLDRAMCFSSSRLPVCLTSRRTQPGHRQRPACSYIAACTGSDTNPSGQIVSMIACTRVHGACS